MLLSFINVLRLAIMVCGLLLALLGFTTRMAPAILCPLEQRDALRDESGTEICCLERSSNIVWSVYVGGVICGTLAPKAKGIMLLKFRLERMSLIIAPAYLFMKSSVVVVDVEKVG